MAPEKATTEERSEARMMRQRPQFQFSPFELAFLVADTIVFGGCVALLLLGKSKLTLILLTIATFAALLVVVAKAGYRAGASRE
jgi:hypothetical protein